MTHCLTTKTFGLTDSSSGEMVACIKIPWLNNVYRSIHQLNCCSVFKNEKIKNTSKWNKLDKMRHWWCALSRKKMLRSMKQADAKPHFRLQGNTSVFHLNLFSRGQQTEEEVWEKHHGVTRLTPPWKPLFIMSVYSDLCLPLQQTIQQGLFWCSITLIFI